MPWYQNPTIVAVLGAVIGALISAAVSLYIWKKTHKIKSVDAILGDITSLLTFSDKIKDRLEIKFMGEEVKTVYLFSLDIVNSGTEAIKEQPVNIRLDESSKIVDYTIKTEPEVGFGDIVEKNKEGNALDLEIVLLNPEDRVSIEVVSLGNSNEEIEIFMKNANVKSRVYSRKSAEKQLSDALSDKEMLLLAGMSSLPVFGSFARSLMTLSLAKKIDKISHKESRSLR